MTYTSVLIIGTLSILIYYYNRMEDSHCPKRVLVTGASGLLGRAIYKEFGNRDEYEVLGLAFSRAGEMFTKLDLTDEREVSKLIAQFRVSK